MNFVLLSLILSINKSVASSSNVPGSGLISDRYIVPLRNRVDFISVEIEIGSPAQRMELLLDTGSSVTWVISKDNPNCKNSIDKSDSQSLVDTSVMIPKGYIDCESTGTFNSTLSETYNGTIISERLSLTYLDTTSVKGNWAVDHFNIPLVEASESFSLASSDFEIGIGTETNSTVGILGLGIPPFTFNKKKNSIKYNKETIITNLRSNKVVERSVFSIYLNDRNGSGAEGELLIGHIDEAKFQAPLYTIKFINSMKIGGPIERFEIPVTDISISTPSRHNSSESIDSGLYDRTASFKDSYIPALLDTGSKFTYLPFELFHTLKDYLMLNYRVRGEINEHLVVPCTEVDQLDDVSFGIKINDITFHIPMRAFLERHPQNITELYRYDQSRNLCLLGLLPKVSSQIILGQAFFRSLYTVFDLDMMEVSIAPARYSTKRSIKEVNIRNGVGGVNVESIAEGAADAIVLDPKDDFIADTRDGFYKYQNGIEKDSPVWFSLGSVLVYLFSVSYLLEVL